MERPKTNEKTLEVTEDDLLEANELADSYTLEECRDVCEYFSWSTSDPSS
jgi:hypothetical protein